MNTSARGIVMGLALTVGCVAGGWAQDAGRPPQAREVEAIGPLRDYTLPYHGYGEVAVLNDGTLVIDMGGEVTFDECEWMTISPIDTLTYWLDSSQVKLVESGNNVFLDKGGAEMSRRGISPQRATITAFDHPRSIKPGAQRQSLADFAGDLEVTFDDKSRRLAVKITDSQEEGKTFTLAGRVSPGTAAQHGAEAAGFPATSGGDDEIVLMDGGDPASLSATCSAICDFGSAAANCEGRATCFCSSKGHPQSMCQPRAN